MLCIVSRTSNVEKHKRFDERIYMAFDPKIVKICLKMSAIINNFFFPHLSPLFFDGANKSQRIHGMTF
jgi:hypothetical protein